MAEIKVRTDDAMKRDLEEAARRNKRSLNGEIIVRLAASLKGKK